MNDTSRAKTVPNGLLPMLIALIRAWFAARHKQGPAIARRARNPRPWQMRIGQRTQPVSLKQNDVDRLLQRHRDLKDMDKLARVAGSFRLPESDYWADARRVERLIRHFLAQDPPWLHVGRVASTMGGASTQTGNTIRQDVVWRERETREMQNVTLFVPSENWRDQPLASLAMRPARHLSEMPKASLLDQILPPALLMERLYKCEILIPNRERTRQRLDFEAHNRQIEIVTRKSVPVPIETEGEGAAEGQLLYILLDFSASMQGKNALLALSVITSVVRANMGRADARYLFRRYAQEDALWPRLIEPPLQARTPLEKDALLDTILATNFNGGATHVNHALAVALEDIENLRRDESLNASLLLVTDGRAEMLESTGLRLRAAQIKVHTVMVTPEPNPGLEALSESFTALDIRPDTLNTSGRAQAELTASIPHSAHV